MSTEPGEDSPSAGWRDTAEAMEVDPGIGEYIEEHKDELEKLAEKEFPISPVIKTLLIRHERGEL